MSFAFLTSIQCSGLLFRPLHNRGAGVGVAESCDTHCCFPSGQVLLSLRILLMMKPSLLNRVSHQVAYGLHELLKTNAANIHTGDDWYTLFTLLECIGSGVKPPAALQATARAECDTGKVGQGRQLYLVGNLMAIYQMSSFAV